ncbi:protein asteroid-like [Halictus rubicundus]|uniref:protein asteroid-like n=1 Tax=Halictus rubicundus TaxID=77578 RepID=UPI004036370C
MGIRGLTTYVNKCSSHCLQDYELQNTYLVIDGNNICYQIFYRYINTNSIFGGDYDIYEEAILKFFDNLLACNVIPLVLLDGGNDILKMDTILKRCKDRYEKVISLTMKHTEERFPPLHSLTIFKQALRKKNIHHAQCLFEADGTIAAIAKILKCPVLSFDSDFYIYGTFYIPFDTLSSDVIRSSKGNGKVIRCKLYNHKYLLNTFNGLNDHTLSLAAAILGQEKINPDMFKNLLHKLHGLSRNMHIIQATFIWLSQCTLEEAIIEILRGIPKSMRQQILDIIESIINDYTCINVPSAILVPLSIPKYTMDSTTIYKFKGNIQNLPFSGIYQESYFQTIDKQENEIVRIKNMLIKHRNAQSGNDSIINKLPTWFVDEISTATLSGSLLNTLDKHSVIFPTQIEDVKRPTCNLTALKIVRVIYGLLSSIVNHKKTCMKYIIRDENMNFMCNEIEGIRTVGLSSLRELPIIKRKDILDYTLGIKNMKCIDELLPEWKLYIACIKYWADQEIIYKSHKCYVYSLILCILYKICGNTKFSKNKSKAHNYKPKYSESTVIEAYRKIDVTNCSSAVQFFNRHSEVQKRIIYYRKVDMSIVHAFAQFQVSVLYAMDLNALLGHPYEEPLIADLFNGTFLYNMCTHLQVHKDIHKYINEVLKDSPTVLTFFNILISKIDPLFM